MQTSPHEGLICPSMLTSNACRFGIETQGNARQPVGRAAIQEEPRLAV
jgi:hypothetical protein